MPQVYFHVTETWWNNRTATAREMIQSTLDEVRIGEPKVFDVGGTRHVVWSHNLTLRQVARVGRDLKDLANRSPINRDVQLTETIDIEVPVRVEVQYEVFDDDGASFDPPQYRTRWEDHPTDTRTVQEERPLGDPATLVLEAQGGPAAFKARTDLPPNATPVDEGI